MTNVLITGAAGGIGQALVNVFARNRELKIIALSRSKQALETLQLEIRSKFDRSIDIIELDLEKPDFEDEVFTRVNRDYGSLTYLINNAGSLINKPFESTTKEDMERQMCVNYFAPFKLIQVLMPLFRKSQDHPHVVNIGSMGGFQGSSKFPGLSSYSSSKAAISSLTECLAFEYKAQRISFNCLALGSANTEMLRQAFPDYTSKMEADRIAEFIADFVQNGFEFFNGKVIPVAGIET
ncbi:MAG: SDR family oxidoreductase [Vicingaceae bacterium]